MAEASAMDLDVVTAPGLNPGVHSDRTGVRQLLIEAPPLTSIS